MSDVLERIRALKIVPVIVIDDPADAAPLGAALSGGGLPCAEVTFRTKGAADAIRRMTDAHPDMLVGAGTVLTPSQVSEARASGATFIVSPGFNPAVVDASQAQGLPVFPGVCTPTEIEAAMGKGLRVLKFFPAEAIGGVNLLKAITAPYGGVEFIPTGGITRENIGKYLALKAVVACGGSWMAPQQMVAAKQFDRVREETAAAVAAVRQPEGGK
jgi:2-dehydro-3-deoxyphosphogluconate aldolase/(4S)-4-hydroxy-2-oxoglutarate aldolase